MPVRRLHAALATIMLQLALMQIVSHGCSQSSAFCTFQGDVDPAVRSSAHSPFSDSATSQTANIARPQKWAIKGGHPGGPRAGGLQLASLDARHARLLSQTSWRHAPEAALCILCPLAQSARTTNTTNTTACSSVVNSPTAFAMCSAHALVDSSPAIAGGYRSGRPDGLQICERHADVGEKKAKSPWRIEKTPTYDSRHRECDEGL
jgi:hypothetical protein